MKMSSRFLTPLLRVGLSMILINKMAAQTFTTLYSFTGGYDGAASGAGLVLSGKTLYGTARDRSSGSGTVFSIGTDGADLTILHSFSPKDPNGYNSDGANPGAVVLSGSTLYGSAFSGGSSADGTIFSVTTNGAGFMTVYTFTAMDANGSNMDGANPGAGLVLSGNTLYGTAVFGGSSGGGTVFSVNTDGTAFRTLHNFNGADGTRPYGGLIMSNNTLYGTTLYGGSTGNGTVFKISTDGTVFKSLYSFSLRNSESGLAGIYTNSDGAMPYAGVVLLGETLYGTASEGGTSGSGTVFALNNDGTGFKTLHTFTGSEDGATPFAFAGLFSSGIGLYGTTTGFGNPDNGSIFRVNIDGTGFTTLYGFSAMSNNTNIDGASPQASLVLSDNILYGTAAGGGSSGDGTIFSISLPVPVAPPQLTITAFSGNVVLTWPANTAGFILQSSTSLVSPVWTTNSAAPVIVNGQNAVTNPILGMQQLFRLSQ